MFRYIILAVLLVYSVQVQSKPLENEDREITNVENDEIEELSLASILEELSTNSIIFLPEDFKEQLHFPNIFKKKTKDTDVNKSKKKKKKNKWVKIILRAGKKEIIKLAREIGYSSYEEFKEMLVEMTTSELIRFIIKLGLNPNEKVSEDVNSEDN